MNKFYETLTNLRGDVLFGYRAQVVDETGASVDIYRDRSGTRFTDGSGNIVNYAEASSDTGMAEFYWTAATGQLLQITDSSGELARSPIEGFGDNFVLGNLSGDLPTTAIDGLDATLATKASTTYVDTGLATKVPTADLASTDTGKGAALAGFKRAAEASARTVDDRLKDTLHAADFGVSPDATAAENTTALQAAIDYMLANPVDRLLLPAGQIDLSGDITVGAHSDIGSNYLAQVTIEGMGAGVNGSWLRFTTGTLIVNAPCHSLKNFRVTSLDGDGIHVLPGGDPVRYPARSEMVNIRAEYCAGSGVVVEDNWLYLMQNMYCRQNAVWGIEGRDGPLTGLACNSWTLIGGEIQGNGTIGGSPLGTGGDAKSTGGGVYTGRSVQMNLLGVSIEGNKSDGLVIGEQARGLLLQGCYFEKNGSHQDDRDIRNEVPSSSTVAPNSIVITNSNFTPQAANGTAAARAIELVDCLDVKIINPQFYALSGPIIYTAEPIRVYESLAGRSTGWVEGGWYSSSLYTQAFLKNECERFGFPRKHVFSLNLALPDATTTATGPLVVPMPSSAGSRVTVNHVTGPGTWTGGSASGGGTGVARIITTIRRGMTGTTVSVKTDDINYASSVTAIRTTNNTSTSSLPGTFALVIVSRDGGNAADTLAVSATLLTVEIITYEGVVSAQST